MDAPQDLPEPDSSGTWPTTTTMKTNYLLQGMPNKLANMNFGKAAIAFDGLMIPLLMIQSVYALFFWFLVGGYVSLELVFVFVLIQVT